MKILVTGANGYIGKAIYNALKNKHQIFCASRQTFDTTSFTSMNDFLKTKYFDVVIHCAVSGGSRLTTETYKDMDDNLASYYNLLQHKSNYNKLIHFGSGAEMNIPETPYGLSKRVIARSISNTENHYNIRIYAVFDENELETRFIKANIKRYIKGEPIIINSDKKMDFFYMKDFLKLVEYYIVNTNPPKEIDCTYNHSYTLSEIAQKINNLNNNKSDIIIQNNYKINDYIGKHTKLLDCNYMGLDTGIKEVYNLLKSSILVE
jgi:nucleoside-diphosphate-sugar epimerase